MSQENPAKPAPIPPVDLTGLELPADRLLEVHEAYRPILAEIRKLRELDLQPIHPAVIFEPTAVYRERGR